MVSIYAIIYNGGDVMGDLGNKEAFAKNLRRQISMSDKTRYQICKDTGIKYSTMSDWLNADTYPRFSRIEKLAAYFGITPEALVGVDVPISMETLGHMLAEADDHDLAMVEKYLGMEKKNKNIVDALINSIIKERG